MGFFDPFEGFCNDTKILEAINELEINKANKSDVYNKTETDNLLIDKVDKEAGKGLSSNDYTTFEKNKLNEIEIGAEVNVQSDWTQTDSSSDDFIKNKPTNLSQFTNDYEFITNDTSSLTNYYKKSDTLSTAEINGILEDKVDKITGKRLSTNDYTTAEKTKLAGIEEEANKTVIDDTLDDSSTNPVQNKVVKAALDTNKNNISSIQQEQIAQNADIATLRLALDTKIYGIRIDKQDANPDTRVTYLYDAVGMTPAYMDFNSGSFNYGSWADIWFIKNNRPIALKFDGTVNYELDHTDFTKKFDGTTSDVSDPNYAGNFMSEMPTVYVKRWEDSRYNYIAFSNKQVNSDFLAQAHTNANGTVNSAIYLPMFKGWKDSNNKLRSLMGTYPTGSTTGTNEVTYVSNNGAGWQIWDKAKIDLIIDLIMLITKSTNCRTKIGNGCCLTYNASDTTNYGKMESGYETDGTTRSASAQFYGSEGTDVTNYGKHHMIAFYIEDLWGNRWDRCLGFNLVDNIYKVKMTPPYVLNSDSTYQSLSVTPPSSTEEWLKNVSSGVYGDVPTEVGASSTSGFASYFYKNASGNRLSRFGGAADGGLRVGRYWNLSTDSGIGYWSIGGSPCYTAL